MSKVRVLSATTYFSFIQSMSCSLVLFSFTSELAKALGRFYAAQVIQLKEGSTKKAPSNNSELLALNEDTSLDTLAFEMSLSIEQIDVTLETYGNAKSEQKKISRNRTYLMVIRRIAMQQRSKSLKQFSRLAINDISIVQMTEVKHGECRVLEPGCEPQHQILGKKENVDEKTSHEKMTDNAHPLTPDSKTQYHPLQTPKELRLFSTLHETTPESCEFIRACLFRDGENHLDEVEFDVTDVIIRVTPTSILDLTKASTRLFELIQLTSKEMERKIHAGRRNKIRENPE